VGMVGLVGPGVPTIPLPHIVEDVWRIVFFLLACAAIAHAAAFILIERARSMTVLMAAMLLVLLAWIAINVLRWGADIYVLGLPVQTIAAVLVIVGVQLWLREPHGAGRDRRADAE